MGYVLSLLIFRVREQDGKGRESGDKGTGSESRSRVREAGGSDPPCPVPLPHFLLLVLLKHLRIYFFLFTFWISDYSIQKERTRTVGTRPRDVFFNCVKLQAAGENFLFLLSRSQHQVEPY